MSVGIANCYFGYRNKERHIVDRYEVIPSKLWQNKETGAQASIYGAVPYLSSTEKEKWSIVQPTWTIRDNLSNLVGNGRQPFSTQQEALAFKKRLDSKP